MKPSRKALNNGFRLLSPSRLMPVFDAERFVLGQSRCKIRANNILQNILQQTLITRSTETIRHRSTSSQAMQDQWKGATQRLMDTEIGKLSAQCVQEMVKLIQSWSQLHIEEGTVFAWNLLDRLLREDPILPDQTMAVLTSKAIGALVHSWVVAPNHLSPIEVNSIIKLCEKRIPTLWVDVVTLNMIIDAAIKRGDPDSHVIADAIIDRLVQGDSPTRPTTILFNTAINAHAKSNAINAPERAEQLLQNMREMTDQGWSEVAPDSVTFGTLISTWTNSGHPQAAKRAEELLMESPDTQSSTFNAVMHAWAKTEGQERQGLDRCLEIFKFMKKQYSSGQSPAIPNAISYAIIIGLLAKQGRAREAEDYVMELTSEYEKSSDPDLAPSRIQFNSLIDAWSRSRDRDAPRRVHGIFRKMQQVAAQTGNADLEPDVVTYTSVLQTLAISRDRDAAPRADAILKNMWDLYNAGNTSSKPNTRTYNKVLDCWLHSRSNDAPLRAEELLRSMQKYSHAGDDYLQPDTTTYALVINIWSKSGALDAPERVETLIDEMELLSTDQTKPVALNKILFNMAIITWSRSGRKDSLERAEKLFKRLERLAEAGWEDMQPNTGVFNAMLSVLAKSRDPLAYEKANKYISQLKERYKRGDPDCKPDTITYSTTLDVLSNSGEQDSLTKIMATLDEMKSFRCKPDLITFNCMVKCLSRDQRKDKAEVAWKHVNMIEREYSLSPKTRTLNEVLSACARSDKYDLATREKAFDIATLTLRRILHENEPDAFSFCLFFNAAAGLQHTKDVESAWNVCCQRGFQNNAMIIRAMQMTAPQFLLGHARGIPMPSTLNPVE